MILDSTFLVDFEREARRTTAGISLGRHRSRWEEFIRPFNLLEYNADVGWHFGEVYRELKAAGPLIGANDIWIAATARAYRVHLVTRNHEDFSRIKGITVLGY